MQHYFSYQWFSTECHNQDMGVQTEKALSSTPTGGGGICEHRRSRSAAYAAAVRVPTIKYASSWCIMIIDTKFRYELNHQI